MSQLDRFTRGAFAALALMTSLAVNPVALGQAQDGACVRATADDVEALHERWNASLQTLHPDRVLRNYAQDANLIGIDATDLREGFLAVRDYYVYFLQREPSAKLEKRVARFGCGTITVQGLQMMLLRPKAKQPHETVPVRVSVTYERQGEHWLITQHHMSVIEAAEDEGVPVARSSARTPAVAGFVKRSTAPVPPTVKPAPQEPVSGYKPLRWSDSVRSEDR